MRSFLAFMLLTVLKVGSSKSLIYDIYNDRRLPMFYSSTTADSLSLCCVLCKASPPCLSVLYHNSESICQYSSDGPEVSVSSSGWVLVTQTPAGKPTLEVGKTASVSSMMTNDVDPWTRNLKGEVALDGNNDTNLFGKSCTHSENEIRPWWKVVFDDAVVVRHVLILNRGDGAWERLHDVVVTVDVYVCGRFPGPGTAGQLVTFTCPTPLVGRKVKVQIDWPDREFLQLCEFFIL